MRFGVLDFGSLKENKNELLQNKLQIMFKAGVLTQFLNCN